MLNSHKVSLEEMWKVIEDFGIKQEINGIFYPKEEQVSKWYHTIKKRNHPVLTFLTPPIYQQSLKTL